METVVRRRAPKRVNADGIPVEQRDWSSPDELQVIGVSVQPMASRDYNIGDARVTESRWILITRPRSDVDIQRGDRIVWRDLTLDVFGEPERWPAVTGGIDHLEVTLQQAPAWAGAGGDTAVGKVTAAAESAAYGQGWTP